ncbi:MAG TPA: DUF6526 family protein [Vicinamibacterales bacterium]|nr:DUF6526 family protein [Vicinamibacterales bacterium]
MAEQSFQSHIHHPQPTYLASVFWLIALVLWIGQTFFGWNAGTWIIAAMLVSLAALVGISRQYTVKLQDRIIMLEVKIRAAELLTSGQDALLAKLTPKQIVALRFASDEEFGSLLERAARENLSPKDIKASIRTWRPDLHRT